MNAKHNESISIKENIYHPLCLIEFMEVDTISNNSTIFVLTKHDTEIVLL